MTRAIVVGARHSRQGTGPYIARSLHRAGIDVVAVVGTTAESAADACRTLFETEGIVARGYASLDAALRISNSQLVAICSPHSTHREQLDLVARAHCHCLCEKPLWWSSTISDVTAADTDALIEGFASHDLLLDTVAQWPYTLKAFDQLHGRASRFPPVSLAMSLSPMSVGAAVIPDCGPHVLSMLQAIAGVGSVERARVWFDDETASTMRLRFEYHGPASKIEVECRFATGVARPRPASYEINGHRVDRMIHLPDYAIAFEANGRSIPIEDPLTSFVADFVRRMHAGETTDIHLLRSAMGGLCRLARAVPSMHGEVRE